jgi:hypothetical protein
LQTGEEKEKRLFPRKSIRAVSFGSFPVFFFEFPPKFKKLKYFCKNSVNTELNSSVFEQIPDIHFLCTFLFPRGNRLFFLLFHQEKYIYPQGVP